MTEPVAVVARPLPDSLNGLTGFLDQHTHLLATNGDQLLASTSLKVTQDLFNLGLHLYRLPLIID